MEMPNKKEKIQVEKAKANLKKFGRFICKKESLSNIFWIILTAVIVFSIGTFMKKGSYSNDKECVVEKEARSNKSVCNIEPVYISGYITSEGINGSESFFGSGGDVVYSDDIKKQLDSAKNNDDIKAVLLNINSYGGDAGSAQEIVYALKNLDKPIVAVIRSAGTSAGYWIASVANKIYAYETADIGSIGVTMSYLDETALNAKEGKYFVSLSSGKFKDMGNPDKPITQEEKALMMRDIKDVYNIFLEQVSSYRGVPIDELRKVADGSSMLAKRAKDNQLIDEIGSSYDAIDYISEIIKEKAEVCEIDKE